jgi:hypothetical protein
MKFALCDGQVQNAKMNWWLTSYGRVRSESFNYVIEVLNFFLPG